MYLHLSNYKDQARVAKPGNRATPLKRYILQIPLAPRLAECLHVMLLAPGQPFCFITGEFINGDDHARALCQNVQRANPQLASLLNMDAGISTTGLRVAGVPIGTDEWVQQFCSGEGSCSPGRRG